MVMNDPLRREEKKDPTPDRKESGPSSPNLNDRVVMIFSSE